MSEVDFFEDSHEISSSYSDSSEVGDVNIGCDFRAVAALSSWGGQRLEKMSATLVGRRRKF